MRITPYLDASSHLADHVARIAAILERGDDRELAARIAAREAATAAALPLLALRTTAGLDATAIDVLLVAVLPSLDLRHGALVRERTAGSSPTVDELVAILATAPTAEAALLAAFAPDAPLVAHGLVQLGGGDAMPLGQRIVTVDDRVVAHLRGSDAIDRRLRGIATLHHGAPPTVDAAAVARVVAALATTGAIVVDGIAGVGKTAVAIAAAAQQGRPALVADVDLIAGSDDPRAMLLRVQREALLLAAQLVLRGWDGATATERPWPAALRRDAITAVQDGAIAVTRDGQTVCRALHGPHRVVVAMPALAEQQRIWAARLGDADAGAIAEVCTRYPLPPGDIVEAAAAARAACELEGRALAVDDLVVAARDRICHRLGEVAELVTTTLAWNDVVLRDDVGARIRELVGASRYRDRVMTDWGFGAKLPYGRATSALFSGPPGTGKTMVASLIGKELGLEVFRVDLSKVVSKYIGETEKNLARVFDEASRCRAIILFDEADSLFAKRTEVRSSNDRYANLEVNFLLQRLEAHDGIVILTTNAATAIDPAFLRRLRFRVEFPAPDEHERAMLWRTMIPTAAPLAGDVDFAALGRRYRLTGGHIKNAVVRAAFLAITDELVALDHGVLVRAAEAEWIELGNLPEAHADVVELPEPPPHDLARGSSPNLGTGVVATGVVATWTAPASTTPARLAHFQVTPATERRLAELIADKPQIGETLDHAFRRKEREIAAVFAALPIAEAHALHRRLVNRATGDSLPAMFERLSGDRRVRLLAFLADARRRAVHAARAAS